MAKMAKFFSANDPNPTNEVELDVERFIICVLPTLSRVLSVSDCSMVVGYLRGLC